MPKEISSIQHLIDEFLFKNRNKVVISHKKGYRTNSITGKDLQEKINKIRTIFRNQKIVKGDKIIVLGSPSIDWVAVYYACILSGVIAVPLDVLSDKNLVRKIQQQVKAKAMFQDRGLASIKLKTYYLNELDAVLQSIRPEILPKADVQSGDIFEIQYTSGTTGEPKGVILTHQNMTAGLNASLFIIPFAVHLRHLNLLPLSHIFGQMHGLFLPMYFSWHVFFLDTIQPKKIVSFIKNKKINSTILVPGILAALRKELEGKSLLFNLGIQFRIIGVGGASLDPELEKWWKQNGMFVVQGYGLTETASIISANSMLSTRTGSVGRISKDVSIQFGPDDEILVAGNNITSGYYKNQKKTQESFDNNWFKTGDVGFIKHGRLYLKERKKDVIVTETGLKAYPVDIETILNKINGMKESCVIEKDKKIHAVLILNKKIDPSEIIKKANEQLLSHQKISSFSIWPEPDFPKTPTDKIKKYIVQQEIGKVKGKEYKYENVLYSIIHDVLKPHQKITEDKKLVDLGMDSLKRVELLSELEKQFGVEIDEVKLDQHVTVAALENLMKEKAIHKIKFRTWPMDPFVRAIQKISQKLLWYPIIRIFTKTEYRGLEHLRDVPLPVIVATNHQSYWDPAIVAKKFQFKGAVAAHPEVVYGIGTKNIFLRAFRRSAGFLASFFFNAYPFGENIGTDTSLEFTGELLDRGYSIGIAPEGTRTLDGEIHKFRPGIGYLAVTMNVPVIPGRIRGMFYVLPRGRIIPRFGKSSVTFGKPIMPETFKGMSYIEATKLIEKKVKEL